jgi:ABC-2 type transport system permease protein
LPSHRSRLRWLLVKESRQLLRSRSWWALLLAMGPLVGICFIAAVHSYADVSGLGGTAGGVGEALWPMLGVWAPTFSACELAAVFLLPFVAIRMVGADRQSGALKLELQGGMNTAVLVTAKAIVVGAGWLIAMLPAISAIPLWKWYGGAVYPSEMFALLSGHILNAGLTIALGAAAAAVAEHPSTAAIITLGVTVGTWIVNFFGAIQGGFWERAAEYTPAAMVADFQHGLVRLDTVLVAGALIVAGFAVAAIWMRLGDRSVLRWRKSLMVLGLAAAAFLGCTKIRAAWDVSANRYNSFSESDERSLRQIHRPLRMEVHLAPEDPRRVDLERRTLSKLRRVLPELQVEYAAESKSGLFEQARSGYGEVWYLLDGHKTMSRVITTEGVLETIYSLAGVSPPAENEQSVFRGNPLAVQPRGAAAIFFFLWPTLILVAGILMRRSFE